MLRVWCVKYTFIFLDTFIAHFSGIVPCGIRDHGVTSLVDLGLPVTLADFDVALKAAFRQVFGPVADAPADLQRLAG